MTYNIVSNAYKCLKRCVQVFIYGLWILYKSIREKRGKEILAHIFILIEIQLSCLVAALRNVIQEFYGSEEKRSYGELTEQSLKKLHSMTVGLHSLLPTDSQYHYSLLMIVEEPSKAYFLEALNSAILQTAPNMEILVGFNGAPSLEIQLAFNKIKNANPDKVKDVYQVRRSKSVLYNTLACLAKGNYLVFMEQDCWLRPDLLFRYEQTLRLLPDNQRTVLYSDEYTFQKGILKAGLPFSWATELYYPYLFSTFVPGCLLVPTSLWKLVNGIRETYENAHFYDLLLRLDLVNAKIHKIPLRLYARREQKIESESQETAIKALADYADKKKLNWNISKGYTHDSLRAIPQTDAIHSIHAIVPYKDHKELTLAAVASLKRQKGVDIKITAVDNRSSDLTIGEELEKCGVEVLRIDEPFNFSRLNNLAVQRTKIGRLCNLLFFMNNDVELHEEALFEMCRWIDQPKIGLVGCRLHYPDGTLQCGGVDMSQTVPRFCLGWDLTESKRSFEQLTLQRTLRVVDAVSGAASLIKKSIYVEIGGFDEIWYPNSYSDTNLSIKLKLFGLLSFYTPFAWGTHHESKSRFTNKAIEDYEASIWLNDHYLTNRPFRPLQIDQ